MKKTQIKNYARLFAASMLYHLDTLGLDECNISEKDQEMIKQEINKIASKIDPRCINFYSGTDILKEVIKIKERSK